MPDHKMLRVSATVLFLGVLISSAAGMFHPGRENANDHLAAFSEYASSHHWTAIHLGQFAGMAVIVAGLVVLFFALDVHSGVPAWAGRFGAVSAVVALALYGVLQGVDGVALKQAVDAWAKAPEAEKAARFASAETIRWLEWAIRSYQSFMLGLALILFATMIGWTARAPRPIGYLMGLSGLAYFVQGWVLGSEGFSPANQAPTVLAVILVLAWSIWFVVVVWKEPVETRPTRASGRP